MPPHYECEGCGAPPGGCSEPCLLEQKKRRERYDIIEANAKRLEGESEKLKDLRGVEAHCERELARVRDVIKRERERIYAEAQKLVDTVLGGSA